LAEGVNKCHKGRGKGRSGVGWRKVGNRLGGKGQLVWFGGLRSLIAFRTNEPQKPGNKKPPMKKKKKQETGSTDTPGLHQG